MEKLKLIISTTLSEAIDMVEDITFGASQDEPYYVTLSDPTDMIFELRFEYMFDEEIKEHKEAEQCDIEYGMTSGKIYRFIAKSNVHIDLIQGVKYICKNIEKPHSHRFDSNIHAFKLMMDAVIPIVLGIKLGKHN